MTKVYSGFEVLEVMKTQWVKKNDNDRGRYSLAYTFVDGKVVRFDTDHPKKPGNVTISSMDINFFLKDTFSVYREPVRVGEFVKIEKTAETIYTKVETVFEDCGRTFVRMTGVQVPFRIETVDRITAEEFELVKRTETFLAAGRNLDVFNRGDVVKYRGVEAIVRSVHGYAVSLTGDYMGHVSSIDLTPIKFVTYTDATDPKFVTVKKIVAPCTAPMMPGMSQTPVPMAAPMGGQF
ncbi:hypothetical protein Blue_035 [Bacillus phage Deep Blue]|uniref:Uncharacterized protein n=1 Tax=Bacillus phage Deep Blue TaxID=1792245 RepID=A0A140HLJ6_9CAUD|nr:hypothetical protein Blue_035 [Bacillus phage Deep Blue]AMO25858.1 hypothetical protein Blue_035 [Bacillus phage Deep Blue]